MPQYSELPTTCDVAIITGGIRSFVVVTEVVENQGSAIVEVFPDIAASLQEQGVVPATRVVWIERINGKPNLFREVIIDDGLALGFQPVNDTTTDLLRTMLSVAPNSLNTNNATS